MSFPCINGLEGRAKNWPRGPVLPKARASLREQVERAYREVVSGSVPTGEVDSLPASLGRYEVLGAIASGGMATVYLARVTGLAGFEREVALKLTHSHLRDEPDFVTSLMDEARLAGRIRHQNVVSVLDVGVDPAGVFIVMDYVDGDSLARIQRVLRKTGQTVPLGIALRIVDDTLAGLHAAHELRDAEGNSLELVHRDVTPHNILLAQDGVARLADFGVAKAASRLGNTSTGLVKGKAAYMSPEQAQGNAIDRRADVWAAGVVAWELFSGQRLYEAPNDAAVLFKVVRDRPMRLSHLRPDIPPAIDDAVARALEPDLEQRFETAEAFADALAAAADEHGLRVAHRDVGRFLEPILAPLLEKRRARVKEVAGLRKPGDSAIPSNPSHPVPVHDGISSSPTVRSAPIASTAATTLDPSGASDGATGGVTALDTMQFAQKRSRPWVVGVAAGFALAVALGAVALWGSSHGSKEDKPSVSATGNGTSKPIAAATSAPALSVAKPEPMPAASLRDEAAPDASVPKPKKRPTTTSAPVDDSMLENPYKRNK
jgi:serine/threonine protein kinase